MNNGQWQLVYPGADYTFGTPDLPVFNHKTPEISTPDIRTADNDRPRGDGRSFGIDYLSGQTISFDLGVRGFTDVEVRELTAYLKSVWRADPVRLTPGAVAELRTQYAGRERVVFGRPRRFSPDYSDASVNRLVSVLADFACIDDLFYSPTDETVEFGIAPPISGGLIAPLASPLSTTRSSDRSQGFTVVSEMPVWPVVTLYGPISDAVITVGPDIRWEVRTVIGEGESVVIDTRPWGRTALLNGVTNIGGKVRGTRLGKSSLPAGSYEMSLQGSDPTGTSRVRLTWRRTYPSL